MSFKATGKLQKIFEAKQVSDRFRKREFVLEIPDGRFPQAVLFQLTGDRCESLDAFKENQSVVVEFNLRGREWTSPKGEVKYFNSLDVWTVKQASAGAGGMDDEPLPDEPLEPMDDVPF